VAYHLFGQWHAKGGSGALIDALLRCLDSYGGRVRCAAPVARIDAQGGKVRAIVLEDGESIEAEAVITAIDPKVALLDLLDPPLGGREGADLAAARRSNVVQALVHVAVDRFTTSAFDETLAPPGHHTVYLACPSAPARMKGGWEQWSEVFVERCLETVEARAPGFRSSIQGVRAFTPLDMERVGRWPLGHPMYLDVTLDQ
jgi:phytoene dehydrogenase-like protein